MDVRIIRENMETEQVLAAKPTQTVVETEIALPGGLREEARVYYAGATVAVNGGELMGNRITADGRVTFHVLYAQGDLSHVSSLETTADFAQQMPLQTENDQSASVRLRPRAEVQHVSAKAFNGRLLLSAIVALTAEATLPRSIAFVKDLEGDGNIERVTQTLAMQRTVGEGENQTLLREEFELPEALQIKNTLFATARAQTEDIMGGADGKATVVGVVNIEAYHTSEIPGRPLMVTRHSMPFEQTVTLSGALGDALAARTGIRDVAVLSQEAGNGGRLMRAEILLAAEMSAVEDIHMTTVADAYSTGDEALDLPRQRVVYRTGTVHEQVAESGKTVMLLPDGSPRVKQSLLGFVRPIIAKADQQGGKLVVDGVMEVTLIYQTDDTAVPVAINQEEPFHVAFSTAVTPQDNLELSAYQVETSAITGDRVELKYILQLIATGVRKESADVISDVRETAAKGIPDGVTLYFVQPEETLWDIAKRYRVPVREIQKLNQQLPDHPRAGTPIILYKKADKA